ncbi:hypothetical protein HMPREF3185_01510 [Porphyromonas somerae]|uniref:Uncharacterized protein n=1 Tax=Porphyromonas somerae TaxID=322095 RepID=A0A134B5L7_9PORP|nr:hypothetical protein HMPREF3184_01510 [Porphyromonadaceae bacterium KA00676]KXB75206.1 hypothetical protein HMPREF3185_01510 [Porphyromonas somerae]
MNRNGSEPHSLRLMQKHATGGSHRGTWVDNYDPSPIKTSPHERNY